MSMHGLRCAGAFAGWTRVCDEWIGALERFGPGGGAPHRAVGVALGRTRAFATGEVEATVASGVDGALRVELQGIPYVVVVAEWACSAGEDLVAGARARLESALEEARSRAGADEHPVAVLVTEPDLGGGALAGREEVDVVLAAFRDAGLTHALAYSFPSSGGVAPGRGALMLARSGVFG